LNNYKIALILAAAALLLSGCSGISKPDTEEKEPSFYSADKIKIEDMDFSGVKFGDTKQEVINKLGEPDGIEELHGAYCYKDFTVNFTQQDKVCEITVVNNNFSCYKDIRQGDDILSVLKKLPIPTAPSGIDTAYKDFSGDTAHDFALLEDYFINNTKNPQIPDELNYTWRHLEFAFDDYILKIVYESQHAADNSSGKYIAGEIEGICVQTADAPLLDD